MQRHEINWRSYPASIRETFLCFRELDLSAVDRIMMDKYSVLGTEPRQPSSMLRSLLLMIKTKTPSITLWVSTLHTSPFYAILSGFEPDDVPGVGTFYDFMRRLWNHNTPNFSDHLKPRLSRRSLNPRLRGRKLNPLSAKLSLNSLHVSLRLPSTLMMRLMALCFKSFAHASWTNPFVWVLFSLIAFISPVMARLL